MYYTCKIVALLQSNYCFFDVFVAVNVIVAKAANEDAKYCEHITLGRCGGVSIARRVKKIYTVIVIKCQLIT